MPSRPGLAGQALKFPLKNLGQSSNSVCAVVSDSVVLGSVRANFVPALSAPDLARALRVTGEMRLCGLQLSKSDLQRVKSLPSVGVLVSAVNLHAQTRGLVGQHDTRVCLIAVLPARPRIARESHVHIIPLKGNRRRISWLQRRDRDSRGVDPASALAWRYALPPVPAVFETQRADGCRRAFDGQKQSAMARLFGCTQALT